MELEQTREIPAASIDRLKAKPSMAASFDKIYGAGAAASVLGSSTVDPMAKAKEEADGPRREMTIAGRIWDNTIGAVVYGAQEALNETVDTFESLDEWYGIRMEEMGIPGYLHVFDKDGTFNPSFKHRSEIILDDENVAFFGKLGVKEDGLEVDIKAQPEDLPGRLIAGASQFLTGYAALGRIIKTAGIAGSFVKGGIVDAAAFDPNDENLSALAEGLGLPDNVITDLLATNPDDPELINRLRNAAEGAIVGGAIEYMVYLVKARSLARAGKVKEAEEALSAAAREAARIEKEVLEAEAPSLLRELEEAKEAAKELYQEMEPTFKLDEKGKLVLEVPEGAPTRNGDQLELDLGDKPKVTPTPEVGKRYLTPKEIESVRYYSKLAATAAPEELIKRTAISTMRQFSRVEDVQPLVAAFAEQFRDEWLKTPGRAPEKLAVTAMKGTVEAKKLGELIGENPKQVMERFKSFSGVDLNNLAGEVAARSYFVNALLEETNALSKAITEGTFNSKMYPGYRNMDDLLLDYQYKMTLARYLTDQNDAAASSLGRALNARKLQRNNNPTLKRLMKDPYFMNDAKIMAKVHQEALKSGDKAILKKVGEVSWFRETLDRINTYRINALLSGPGTQEVNFLSNLLNSVMIPTQQIVGGAVRFNLKEVEDGLRTIQGMVASSWDSIDAALRAWEMEDAILDPMAQKVEGDLAGSGNVILKKNNVQENQHFSKAYNIAVDPLEKTMQLPSRFLLVMDEFFKQSAYRGVVFADANRMAQKANLKGKARTDFIKGYIKNSFDDAGRGIRDDAILQAQRTTFTEPLDPKGFWGAIQRIAINYPAARFIVPFIRTPVNLLIASWQHLPGLGLIGKRMQDDLKAGGRRRSQAIGKQAIGLAILTMVGSVVSQGNITGSGPSDPRLRKVWLKNNKPYSIRIDEGDGKVRWVSYQRLEPFANLVAVAADYHEILSNKFNENAGRGADGVLIALFSAAAENSVNKTFTQGIYDFMKILSDPDPNKQGRALAQMAASFVPNIANQLNGDMALRDARNLNDMLWSRTGNFEKVDVQRNILGEPVLRNSPKWDPLNAMYKDVREIDPVMREIEAVGIEDQAALGAPVPTIADPRAPSGRLDLREVPYNDNQSLYDKWMEQIGVVEIRGRTLRQSLERLFESKNYRLAPDKGAGKGTKLSMIREVVTDYREAARLSVPELKTTRAIAERAVAEDKKRQYQANRLLFPTQEHRERSFATGRVPFNEIMGN